MAEYLKMPVPSASPQPPKDGSLFMRPFALGLTAFLLGLDWLYVVTRGEFRSPDTWSDVYWVILSMYAGATEVKRLTRSVEATDPNTWDERVRKGGPIITAWFLTLFIVGFWRIYDPTRPMPPELKETALKVATTFFGAYALRQWRKGSLSRQTKLLETSQDEETLKTQILQYLRANGPSKPKTLIETTAIPRRTLQRLLGELVETGRVTRVAQSATDPQATYRVV